MDIDKRKSQLKNLKNIANTEIKLNKQLNLKVSGWKKSRIEKNIYNLKVIVSNLNRDLGRNQIKKYVNYWNLTEELESSSTNFQQYHEELSKIPSEIFEQLSPTLTLTKISYNTVLASIVYDIDDLIHPHIEEIIDISLGNKTPEILTKYIPNIVGLIRTRLTKLKIDFLNIERFEEVIKESLEMSEKKSYASSNTLILPVIEGIAKELIKYVYEKQKPELDESVIKNEIYHKYTSLSQLVYKIKLKDDFPVNYIQALNDYHNSNHPTIVKMDKKAQNHMKAKRMYEKSLEKMLAIFESEENGMTEEEKTEKTNEIFKRMNDFVTQNRIENFHKVVEYIPLNEKLNFLVRGIYEDRNKLMHGQFHMIENSWKNYMYLNALEKLFETVDEYKKIYNEKSSR